MSLLNDFQEFMSEISVYSMTTATSAWGTSEKAHPAVATKTITGYIQPLSGSAILKNQNRTIDTTHILYTQDPVDDSDKLLYNCVVYFVTDNQTKGIGGISDHYEVGLKRGE